MKTDDSSKPDQPESQRPLLRYFNHPFVFGSLIVIVSVVLFIVGTLVGHYFLESASTSPTAASSSGSEATIWTCPMHPQIELPEPGQCPICSMDLVPQKKENEKEEDDHSRQLKMSPRAMRLAEIQTSPVRQAYATKEVRLVGKVDYDETKIANITAWVPGRLDRLFVDYTGVPVRKGEHLVQMYSPDLIVAQRELIQTWKAYNRPDGASRELTKTLLKSAEEKLRLLGLLPKQIEEIKRRGEPIDELTIYAPIGGIVIDKMAKEGMYVKTGTKIYTIADLSEVWVNLDAYETDVPWLRYGQKVKFTTEALPGETFQGRIAFIDPMLNEKTRTVRVRVNVPNSDGKLKPGMFVEAKVLSQLAANNRVFDLSLVGKWISPMHPEVVKDKPGKCDICGMDLVPAESLGYDVPKTLPEKPLLIPATAPLITGKRAVVYVQVPNQPQPTFEGRDVILGARAGDDFIVRKGLKKGELVVTNGNFKIDSALQIQKRPSMMLPEKASTDRNQTQDSEKKERLEVPNAFRRQLADLYESYFQLQTALADDRLDDAKTAIGHLQAALKKPDHELLRGLTLLSWSTADKKLQEVTAGDWKSEDIEKIRKRFEAIAGVMLDVADQFGHPGDETYYQAFCPMAFHNQGAPWLQVGQQIANPYFGHAMLHCGEIQRDFRPTKEPAARDEVKPESQEDATHEPAHGGKEAGHEH